MANQVFNRALGRVTELAERVEANDPTNSAFIVIVFNAGDTDATIKDVDTVAAIEALASTAEVTNSGYARKTLANGSLTITYDDTNDRVDIDFADQTWTGVAAGDAWTDICIAYDSDTTAGTDANIIPMTWHDFALTPDGSDVTAQVATSGFFRAS